MQTITARTHKKLSNRDLLWHGWRELDYQGHLSFSLPNLFLGILHIQTFAFSSLCEKNDEVHKNNKLRELRKEVRTKRKHGTHAGW